MCSDLDELIWRPYSELSGGERTKVQLSILFKNDDVFPLIDEPTNHLDKSRKQVVDYLKHKKQGFIVVSHDKENRDQNYLEENQKLKSEIKLLREIAREKKKWIVQREKDNHGNPHIKGSGGTGHDGFTSARAKL